MITLLYGYSIEWTLDAAIDLFGDDLIEQWYQVAFKEHDTLCKWTEKHNEAAIPGKLMLHSYYTSFDLTLH